MAKELGLHASNHYLVKSSGEYITIRNDMDAMNLYEYMDKNNLVHVYVEPNKAEISGGIETPNSQICVSTRTSFGSVRRRPKNVKSIASNSKGCENEKFELNVDRLTQVGSKPSVNPEFASMIENLEGFETDDEEDTYQCRSLEKELDDDVAGGIKKMKYPIFNEDTDFDNPTFCVGMEFKTLELFRNAVKEYAIKWGKSSGESKLISP
ncbi:hypothetical protein Dimus_030937 [Dionaea muscipula]